jgi:hypothetical protein
MQAVYTVLLGGYERLNEPQIAKDSALPFFCFTDDPHLMSELWTPILVSPSFPLDLVRSQRDIKIRGHEALEKFDETLYIDNSIELTSPPEQILEQWLDGFDIAIPVHSFRDTVALEFEIVAAQSLDDPRRVQEQFLHYQEVYPNQLAEVPYWNAIIARRHTPEIRVAMGVWFDHLLRYSRRDQLSANVAFHSVGLEVNPVEVHNHDSEFHRWRVPESRQVESRTFTSDDPPGLLATIHELRGDIRHLNAVIEGAETELGRLHSSLSWKLTRPVRWLGSRLRP